MKMKLASHRVRSIEELWALEDNATAVGGPSPAVFAARYSLKLSKPYAAFLQRQKAGGNGVRKAVQRRPKQAAA